MSKRETILKLAKVIIAVAWTDGKITNEEINSLKDLLFSMRKSGFDEVSQFNAREWAQLEMYLESPVEEAERKRLVLELRNALRTPDEKQLAINALQSMVEADGVVSSDEEDVVEQISLAIEAAEVGILGGLRRIVGGAMERHTDVVAESPNREVYFDDFIKNKVYYRVNLRLQEEQRKLAIPEADLRKLGLVGGLMAKIAHLDRQVSSEEYSGIINIVRHNWGLSQEEATFVTEVAVSAIDVTYDTFRMIRELTTTSSVVERRQILTALFAVAALDGEMAPEEIEEIRLVARGFDLTHRDFIDAKLTVLGVSRPGSN